MLILAICVTGIFCAVSCGARAGDPLAYRTQPFKADISGNITSTTGGRVDFSATLEFFEYAEDGSREFLMLFHAPEALSGLSVRSLPDGGITFSLDGMTFSLRNREAVGGFIKIAEMLDPSEEVLRISSIPGASAGLAGFSYLTLIETATQKIYVDPHTSYPVKAEFSGGEIEICFETVTCRT